MSPSAHCASVSHPSPASIDPEVRQKFAMHSRSLSHALVRHDQPSATGPWAQQIGPSGLTMHDCDSQTSPVSQLLPSGRQNRRVQRWSLQRVPRSQSESIVQGSPVRHVAASPPMPSLVPPLPPVPALEPFPPAAPCPLLAPLPPDGVVSPVHATSAAWKGLVASFASPWSPDSLI